jgi:hypothetical protein
MSYLSRIGAVLSGVVLCIVSPFALFFDASRLLGPDYKFTAIEGALHVLPLFVVSSVWCWTILRWIARPPRVGVWWCLAGLIVGSIYLHLISSLQNYEWCSVSVRLYRSWYECRLTLLPARFSDLEGAGLLLTLLSGLAAAAATVLKSDRVAAHNESGKKELLPLHSALGTWALSALVVASLSASYTTWSDFRDYASDLDSRRESSIRSFEIHIGATIYQLQRVLPAAHKREEFWGWIRMRTTGFPPSRYGEGLLANLRGLRELEPTSPGIDWAIAGTVKLSELAAERSATGSVDVADSDRELVNGILRTHFGDPRWKKGWN